MALLKDSGPQAEQQDKARCGGLRFRTCVRVLARAHVCAHTPASLAAGAATHVLIHVICVVVAPAPRARSGEQPSGKSGVQVLLGLVLNPDMGTATTAEELVKVGRSVC